MGVIDDLKRLERTVDETSGTNQKLCDAAKRVLWQLMDGLGLRPDGLLGVSLKLPRGYVLSEMTGKDLPEEMRYAEPEISEDQVVYLLAKDRAALNWGRGFWPESARIFGKDLATGWLAEVAEWVRKRAQEDEALISKIAAAQQETSI